MSYEHTQRAPLFWMLLAAAAAVATFGSIILHESPASLGPWLVGAALVIAACCFGQLTVRDKGRALSVRFGPLPLFGTRVEYSRMTGVEAARSDWRDGWGIHWSAGRGYIYNLWGFDCVRIRMDGKTVRIGTDDVNGLLRFLRTRIASPD